MTDNKSSKDIKNTASKELKIKQSCEDYWEDWDYCAEPQKSLIKENSKQLEERKLMEEADNKLIEQLFNVVEKEKPDDYYHKYN
jgi:hypothetical protein